MALAGIKSQIMQNSIQYQDVVGLPQTRHHFLWLFSHRPLIVRRLTQRGSARHYLPSRGYSQWFVYFSITRHSEMG